MKIVKVTDLSHPRPVPNLLSLLEVFHEGLELLLSRTPSPRRRVRNARRGEEELRKDEEAGREEQSEEVIVTGVVGGGGGRLTTMKGTRGGREMEANLERGDNLVFLGVDTLKVRVVGSIDGVRQRCLVAHQLYQNKRGEAGFLAMPTSP